MPTITPFLWFDTQAEEAMNFYTSIFKDSSITSLNKKGETVFSGTFELNGQKFMALNGGPTYKFNEAISMFVDCKTQEEVDELWSKLSEGGEILQCGWLKDKYGLTWQIIPSILGEMLNDPDPIKAQGVMQAMMQMKKIDIKGLETAYNQA